MKTQELHGFTTFDTFSVLFLIVGVLVLIGNTVSSYVLDYRPEQAKRRATQLAQQIVSGGMRWNPSAEQANPTKREIASERKLELNSVGRIGMDPWGNPFYYRILSERRVAVLSLGPDGQFNTDESLFYRSAHSNINTHDVRGDDIISIYNGH